MPAIIGALPYNFTNGTTADATQVDADLNAIVSGVNTNGAENGANVSITSLSGLTTPLSIAQGGTGATTASGALSTLGAVSSALASAKIYVGNSSGVAAGVAVSGDVALTNAGATTVESIQGTAVSGTTGSGNVVLATAPTTAGLTDTGTITAAGLKDTSMGAAGIVVNNSSGVLSTATALPNGTTATTQSESDNSTKVATTAFVHGYVPTALGVGSIIFASYAPSVHGNISAGSSVAAANLTVTSLSGTGSSISLDNTGDTISGTWQALQSMSYNGTQTGLFQRIS